MNTTEQVFAQAPYLRRVSSLPGERLLAIDSWLQSLLDTDSPALRKTHYFHGRFENLYINDCDGTSGNADLDTLMQESLTLCAELLGTQPEQLRIGYWFNHMQPGQVTTLHRHDDFDELISGVVYLAVPEQSGDLVLVVDQSEINLPPVMGNFVYFSPETPHRVEENRSNARRVSIGMNIGPARPLTDGY